MCFSAEASFTAAVFLTAMGTATLRITSSRSQFFLATIPLLFALQQFLEGFIWLHLTQYIGSHHLFFNAQRIFLMFAFLIWPIWIPLSFALIETVPWRRTLLFITLYFGIALSFINLLHGLRTDISVQAVNHSLQYTMGYVPQIVLYPFIVLLPMFLSSSKRAWIFGILVTIGYIIAWYFYATTFTSVWCFFTAIVSFSIYKILKDHQLSLEKGPSN